MVQQPGLVMHIQEKLQSVHGNLKTLGFDRLHYKIKCVKCKALQRVFRVSGNEYTGRNFFHLSPEFEPAQFRHIDIEEHRIRHFLFSRFKGRTGCIKETCYLNKRIPAHKRCCGVAVYTIIIYDEAFVFFSPIVHGHPLNIQYNTIFRGPCLLLQASFLQ